MFRIIYFNIELLFCLSACEKQLRIMNGRLTVNRIRNCEDLKINMDDAIIVGNYSSLDVNDVADSKKVDISMNRMRVMTTDQYKRGGYGRHSTEAAGPLTVNRIKDCDETTISQQGMNVKGRFTDVKINDVSSSRQTGIDMRRFRLDDDSDSDSDDDSYRGGPTPGHPVADTSARNTSQNRSTSSGYYRTETVAFAVNLGRGANISLNYDPHSIMKDFKEFLGDKYKPIQHKSYRLQVVGTEPPRYVDNDPYKSLKDCGIVDRMDLRVVHNQPQSDT